MSRSGRLSIALGIFVVGIGLAVFAASRLLAATPPAVDFTAGHQAGQPVNMTIQTVGSIGVGYGPHPTWVSYLVQSPSGQWVHSTVWTLPAHTRINVTLYQYDSGGPLRNQILGQVAGTIGNSMLLNGHVTRTIDSNSSTGNGVGHTFSIPTLGINVPLYADSGTANLCGQAPCTTSSPNNVIKFSFMTPGPGNYPWQCFLPCGLGFLYGNGGPMQTLGYMDGFLKVTA